MTVIEARNVEIRHGAHTVLRDVNLSIERGEIVTIAGPNGSGKSSLLRALIGAIRPARGSVTPAPGLRIGYMPQRLHIDPTLPITVRRFLSPPRRHTAPDPDRALEQAGLPISRAGR